MHGSIARQSGAVPRWRGGGRCIELCNECKEIGVLQLLNRVPKVGVYADLNRGAEFIFVYGFFDPRPEPGDAFLHALREMLEDPLHAQEFVQE